MRRREFTRTLLGLPLAGAIGGTLDGRASAPQHDGPPLPAGGSLTDVPGLKVGHFTLSERPTGCTVVLCENGAVAGVDVRGSAPGTRETELLAPTNVVDRVNAILLSGGSAYGLDAATGVMRFLEEHRSGYAIGQLGVVPIVPAAILMDLGVGDFRIRPTADSGYKACQAATAGPVAEGSVGAGAGATVGKMFGMKSAMKSGIGSASVAIGKTGIVVAALAAVNALGDVVHPGTNQILAGARDAFGAGFRDTTGALLAGEHVLAQAGANTTLGIVATNAPFNKTQMTKIAQMAHDGFARAIHPVHTMADGDVAFALSTGTANVQAEVSAIGAIGAVVMQRAIVRAVTQATGLPQFGLPAWRDLAPR